jgi:hypothetical protein
MVAWCPGGKRRGAVLGLSPPCGVEVFSDALGVDEPARHSGGDGDGGRSDWRARGL